MGSGIIVLEQTQCLSSQKRHSYRSQNCVTIRHSIKYSPYNMKPCFMISAYPCPDHNAAPTPDLLSDSNTQQSSYRSPRQKQYGRPITLIPTSMSPGPLKMCLTVSCRQNGSFTWMSRLQAYHSETTPHGLVAAHALCVRLDNTT